MLHRWVGQFEVSVELAYAVGIPEEHLDSALGRGLWVDKADITMHRSLTSL
ncbi:hypothetical protein D3C79_647060 [compost metagenome]